MTTDTRCQDCVGAAVQCQIIMQEKWLQRTINARKVAAENDKSSMKPSYSSGHVAGMEVDTGTTNQKKNRDVVFEKTYPKPVFSILQ